MAGSRIARLLFACCLFLVTVGGATAASTLSSSSPAGASCSTPVEQGSWRNVDANTRAMTRVDVSLRTCGDQVLCDTQGNCTRPSSTFNVHPWGKCTPTDCDWGTRVGTQRSDGWIVTSFDFGFKTSHVWVKTYDYWGLKYLRVWVNNDFPAADGRTDYVTDEWFLK